LHRQVQILEMLPRYDWPLRHGVAAEMARELGVSQPTISRDLKSLFREYAVCPTCHSTVHADQIPERRRTR
jgi:hypothetical protein